jgi:hypothetical protein
MRTDQSLNTHSLNFIVTLFTHSSLHSPILVPSLHYVSSFTHFRHTTLSFHPHFTRTPLPTSQDFTVVITHTLSSLTPSSQSQPQVQTTRLIGDTMPLSLPDEDSIQAVLEDTAKLPSPLTHNDPPYTSVQRGGDGALLKFLSQFVEIEEKRATRARDRARFLASQSKQNQKSA